MTSLRKKSIFPTAAKMILEKKLNTGQSIENLINNFYLLENLFYSLIQEFDYNYIDHLIRNTREKVLSLEEELIRLQINMAEHNYDKTIRF